MTDDEFTSTFQLAQEVARLREQADQDADKAQYPYDHYGVYARLVDLALGRLIELSDRTGLEALLTAEQEYEAVKRAEQDQQRERMERASAENKRREDLARTVACTYCSASEQQPCRTPNGVISAHHRDRYRAAQHLGIPGDN